MNIFDRILPVDKGDEIRFHFRNGSIRTVAMRGYMIGCEDGLMPVLFAKLTDTFGKTFGTPYRELVHSLRKTEI